ncbi:MAG: hypothetical protein U0271_22160 [Polyangiaceae bacterium]
MVPCLRPSLFALGVLATSLVACGDDTPSTGGAGGSTGGAGAQGGAATVGGAGGVAMGGAPSGGAPNGGAPPAGGAGGEATGGAGGSAPLDPPPDCPPGTTQLALDTTCTGQGPSPSASLASKLTSATRGDVVTVGNEIDGAACLPMRTCTVDNAPTLIFSDEPERTAVDGVLYAAQVTTGRYRIYLYHVNDAAPPRRFTLVALNQDASPGSVRVEKLAYATPSASYLDVGAAVAQSFLGPQTPKQSITVAAGERVVVDPELDALVAQNDELIHAILEVQVIGVMKLSVVSVPGAADAAQVTAGLSLLPNTGVHVRGTFQKPDRVFLARHSDALTRLRFGANDAGDPDLAGTSFVDANAAVTNKGNYGSIYDVRLEVSTLPLALALNPRGGAWQGTIVGTAGLDAGGGLVALPAVSTDNDVVSLGHYATGFAIGTRVLSAGGSSLPFHFVVAPTN